MISEWLKKERNSLWKIINGNSTTKQKLKSIDNSWKQIEKIVGVELNLLKKIGGTLWVSKKKNKHKCVL
jgi:hypothetical protein